METGQATEERLLAVALPRARSFWRRYLPGIGGAVFVVLGCITWAVVTFGSLYHGWLYASGVRVMMEPTSVVVPEGQDGEPQDTVFVIRNLTNRPVRIVGATTTCTCVVATDKLPLVVPAKGTTELHAALGPPSSSTGRSVAQFLVYHTDHPAAPRFAARITARVIEP